MTLIPRLSRRGVLGLVAAVAVGLSGTPGAASPLAVPAATPATPHVAPQSLIPPPPPGAVALPAAPAPAAIGLCTDDTGSVPPALSRAAVAYLARALQNDVAASAQAGYPSTQVEVIKLGRDTFTPSAVLVQGVIPAVHPAPTNPFLNNAVRQRILTVERGELGAAQASAAALAGQIRALRFPVENATDLLGCPARFSEDQAQVPGRRYLVIASDLQGAAPGSDHAVWHLAHTTVAVYLYCSNRSGDSAAACQGRRDTWGRALTQAGASVVWYSSDNLATATRFGG